MAAAASTGTSGWAASAPAGQTSSGNGARTPSQDELGPPSRDVALRFPPWGRGRRGASPSGAWPWTSLLGGVVPERTFLGRSFGVPTLGAWARRSSLLGGRHVWWAGESLPGAWPWGFPSGGVAGGGSLSRGVSREFPPGGRPPSGRHVGGGSPSRAVARDPLTGDVEVQAGTPIRLRRPAAPPQLSDNRLLDPLPRQAQLLTGRRPLTFRLLMSVSGALPPPAPPPRPCTLPNALQGSSDPAVLGSRRGV